MRKRSMIRLAGVLCLTAVCLTGCGKKKTNVFEPRLDTEAQLTLNTCGFFGNFEALDAVTNDFNKYYPNVTFSYEQVGSENFDAYIDANPTIDIMMNSAETLEKYGDKLQTMCADLSKSDVNLSDIDERMLKGRYYDGKLLALPMGQNIYGIVVNKSLLEREGLSVPEDYESFLSVLATLKDKGYTPIQGSDSKVYAELTGSMVYDMLLEDEDLYQEVSAGNGDAVDKLLPVYDKLDTMIENGYTDPAVNQTYPQDNYDEAILKFFEGDVPFWVCNTEKVSGMKKRESKSEAFQADPFEYTFIQIPLGEKGVYAYTEPWFGFSANTNSENYEYALEFIRFLATKDEINQMGDIKGIPSVAKKKTDVPVYADALEPKKVQSDQINDGRITFAVTDHWYSSVNKYISGEYATKEEALQAFIESCKQ